jgi:hypothetical protein
MAVVVEVMQMALVVQEEVVAGEYLEAQIPVVVVELGTVQVVQETAVQALSFLLI